jgi:gliding motility-associated protein GldL
MKPGSKAWKNFMSKLYGFGAAIVIVGAMFKIEHWPGASLFLIIGLSTEALIFVFSSFEPLHEDPDWSLVYPELALPEENKKSLKEQMKKDAAAGSRSNVTGGGSGGGSGTSQQLDKMLEEAKVDSELIASLGEGMRTFSQNARQLGETADAASAASDYASSLRNASGKVAGLADTYAQVSEGLTGLAEQAKSGESTGAHLQKMSENLASLNNMYELQLNEMSQTRALYADMHHLVTNLSESVEDTKRYKENIAELANNLKSLNTVYANMLNAMGTARQ